MTGKNSNSPRTARIPNAPLITIPSKRKNTIASKTITISVNIVVSSLEMDSSVLLAVLYTESVPDVSEKTVK